MALPEVPVSLLWHASYDHDPAHLWLRRTVARVAAETQRGSTARREAKRRPRERICCALIEGKRSLLYRHSDIPIFN